MTFPAIIADDGFEVALTHSASGEAGKAKQLVTLNGGTKQRDYTMGGMGGSARVNDLRLLSMIGNAKSLILKGDPLAVEDIVTNGNEPRLDLDVLRAFGADIAQPGAAAFIREVAALAISSSPTTVQGKQAVAEIANLKKVASLDPTPQAREAIKQAIARSVERLAEAMKPATPPVAAIPVTPDAPAAIAVIPPAIAAFAQDIVKQVIFTHNMPELAPMAAQIAAYTAPATAAPATTEPQNISPAIAAAVAQIVQEATQNKTIDLSSPQAQVAILDTLAEKLPAAKMPEIKAALTQALTARGVEPAVIAPILTTTTPATPSISSAAPSAPAASTPATASFASGIIAGQAAPQAAAAGIATPRATAVQTPPPAVTAAAVTQSVRPEIIQAAVAALQTPVQPMPVQQTPVPQMSVQQMPAQSPVRHMPPQPATAQATISAAPARPANINTPPPASKTPDAPVARDGAAQPVIKNPAPPAPSAPPVVKPVSAAPPVPAKPEKNMASSPASAPKNPPSSGPAERPVIAPKNPVAPAPVKPAQPAVKPPEKNQEPPKPATPATPCGNPVCNCGKDFNEKAAPPPTVVTYDHTGKPVVVDIEREKEKTKKILEDKGADQTGLSPDELRKIVENKPESKTPSTKQEFDLCSCGKKGPHSHGTAEVKAQKISEDAILSNTTLTAKPTRPWGKKTPG